MNTPLSSPHSTPLPSGSLAAPDGSAVRVRVDYPVNPTFQRVAAVVVHVDLPQSTVTPLPSSLGALTVRLTAPGCQVVPDVATLDLTRLSAATFHLTPLAEGPLLDAGVEVLRNGQLLQRVGVPMHSTARGGWHKFLWAALALPLAWWWLTGADAAQLGDAAASRLPLGPSAASAMHRAADALANVERSFRIGFLLAAVLLGSAGLSFLAARVRRRTTYAAPVALAAGMPQSSRGRPVPAYLTPVPPEELNQVQL